MCYYTVEALQLRQRFISEIRTTFGAGGFVCSFNEKELADFHQFLEKDFPFSNPTKVKQGVECVGKQPGKEIWALNKHLFIDGNGDPLDDESNTFAWQPIGGPSIALAGKASVPVDLQCDILIPLQSERPLANLLGVMKVVLKHNFIPGGQ